MAIPVVLYHIYRTDVGTLLWIIGIFLTLFLFEFLYLEHSSFDPGSDP
ncbi:hypothetical protein [Natronomonas sp. LN261]|nr:hypothetical protein [Natronomonas sp. LN261]